MATQQTKKRLIPWTEKYRPKNLDDVSSQEEVVLTLKKSIQSKNLPHLLFYGPPGSGKTSTILAIGRQMYGPLFDDRVLELNASDERGINIVRKRIKNFAQQAASSRTEVGLDIPAYKLIVLDEADSMTPDAQAALRRTMETFSKSTRFCIICNYVSRIIEPIASRCAKFRFKPLSEESAVSRLESICKAEGVPIVPDVCKAASNASGGDLRKAINFLQSAWTIDKKNISPNSIVEVSGQVPEETMNELVQTCKSNNLKKVIAGVQSIIQKAYPGDQILSQLFDWVVTTPTLGNTNKANISLAISEAEKCLVDGADEFLQLVNVCAFVMKEMATDRMDLE